MLFSLLYCTISITIANGSVVDVKDHMFIHSVSTLFFSIVSSTLLFVFSISAALINVLFIVFSVVIST